MSAQSITNAIGRITVNPSKNIPVSTQIVEAVTNYLKKNNIEDPERAMEIISTIITSVHQKGEELLRDAKKKSFGSESARRAFENGIERSIAMIVDRLDKLRNQYVAQNQPLQPNIGIEIPMRLEEIQQRLRIFRDNQNNPVEYSQMEAEAIQLLDELNQIQRRLPPSESAVYGHKTKVAVRGLNRHIDQLKVSLTHFINFFGRMKATKAPEYEASVAAALNPLSGRRKDLSLEERVALLHTPFSGRGTKKEPGERYFEGGKRKTRKRRRRRKRKTRKHRKKKRTRRRKPKKRHRRTRRK
tara:strand:+ start:2881 stop:3780 length:900 start_codon:yes stop_codon:yes gene_type:complete